MSNPLTLINTAIYSRLTTTAGTALWGTRVYALTVPANTAFPYVRFTPLNIEEDYRNAIETYYCQYQFDLWALNQNEARLGVNYFQDAFKHVPLSLTGFDTLFIRTESTRFFVDVVQQVQYYCGCLDVNFAITQS